MANNGVHELIMNVNYDWNAQSSSSGKASETYCLYSRGMAGKGCVRLEDMSGPLEFIARTVDTRLHLENEDRSPMFRRVVLYCVANPENINRYGENSYEVNAPQLHATREAISVAGAGKEGVKELVQIQKELIRLFDERKAVAKEKGAAEISAELITGEDNGPLGPNPHVKRGQGPGDAGIGPHPFRKY